ncbi:hypothetical protein [Spirosoma terrae]|uniref:Uncharacterized protein n=1 Tax=Spirosoma terrae TaxID=1968276 RepID=A0A6L9L599_9BACT|nr:hypothetical protein [Spirosoma terrae]NDU95674.1 hypothetical protein [Spirosoma terrae]
MSIPALNPSEQSTVGQPGDILLEEMWAWLGDTPINVNDEIDEPFLDWPKGTHREDIWHFFDEHHSKGVAWLMQHNNTV